MQLLSYLFVYYIRIIITVFKMAYSPNEYFKNETGRGSELFKEKSLCGNVAYWSYRLTETYTFLQLITIICIKLPNFSYIFFSVYIRTC